MAGKSKTTIHDIAGKLNITASTVSRALNNNPRISEATRKLVQKTAKQLGYQPNNIAAALRHGRSHIIGVIVPIADRNFFATVVRGIEEIANKINYKVIICQSYDNYETEVQTVNALLNARVDGIIASIGKNTEDFSHFRNAQEKLPLLLFDRTTDELEVSQVVIDDFLGAYKITQHLIEQGCRRIAHFTSPNKISIYKERLRGYTEALENHGISFEQELVVESNMQLEGGRQSMEALLKLDKMPDAIFSASDYGAMGAMQVLKERKIQIPQQVALAGFSNEPFTSFTDPTLTTIDQLGIAMGNVAAELFFEQLKAGDKPHRPQKTVLKPELIIRQSSHKKGLFPEDGHSETEGKRKETASSNQR
jgi:LacI family transcriptional regulator